MQRLTPYLGIVACLVFFALVMTFANQVSVVRTSPASTPVASSTLAVEPGFTLPPLSLPNLESTADSPATSSAKTVPTRKPKSTPLPTSVPVVVPVPISTPIPPVSSLENVALDTAASTLRGALVNIICYVPLGSGLHSISGSGVIIDSKGIILTNAHIAQYFLLADRSVSCTIRAGSPAIDSYEASLLYIPSAWLNANPTVLTQTNPSGTGEYDFALIAVSKSVTRNALPVSFPFIALATNPPLPNTPVVIASYGAQFLESAQVQSSLFPTIVFGSVKEVFTFATNTSDVLALGGSAAAQEGSSGGGVSDTSGTLIGTITTSTIEGSTDTRSLDAITASYIRAEYANETGSALDLLLAKETSVSIADFASRIPALESIITANLP